MFTSSTSNSFENQRIAVGLPSDDLLKSNSGESHVTPNAQFVNCSICIAPLTINCDNEFINTDKDFSNYSSSLDSFVVEAKTLLKILDINLSLYETNSKRMEMDNVIPQGFPVCKPCYVEIVKYEKLQMEIQRIVDQIVSSVLENFEYETDGEEIKNNFGTEGQNLLGSLQQLILKRWKPIDPTDSSDIDNNNSDTVSASVLKAIAEALNVQPHELVITQGDQSIPNSAITVEVIDESDKVKFTSVIPNENIITYGEEISSIRFNDKPIDFGNKDLGLDPRICSEIPEIPSTSRNECHNTKLETSKSQDFQLDQEINLSNQGCKKCPEKLEIPETLLIDLTSTRDDEVEHEKCTKTCPICPSQMISNKMESDPIESVNRCENCQQITEGNEGHDCNSPPKLRSDRKGPFICMECKKEFRQQRDLDVHVRRSHTGERPFICDVCGKSYPAQSALQHHQKVHSQRFVCDICGIAVVTETGLKKHMKIHEGTKDFQCDICSRKFMWKQSLIKHQAIHTGDKPYGCQFCPRTFPIKDYLHKHVNRRHPEGRNGQDGILNCPYCENVKFRTAGNLSSHILRKHSSTSASYV